MRAVKATDDSVYDVYDGSVPAGYIEILPGGYVPVADVAPQDPLPTWVHGGLVQQIETAIEAIRLMRDMKAQAARNNTTREIYFEID